MSTPISRDIDVFIDVLIVGGGPAGLMLALELGCRGVRCVLLEEDVDAPAFPKANATSSRTMEHYRRRGLSAAMRATGLVEDHPKERAAPADQRLAHRVYRQREHTRSDP